MNLTKANHTRKRSGALRPGTFALAIIGVTVFSAAMLLPQPRIIAALAITSGSVAVLSYKFKPHSIFALLIFFTLMEGESLYAPIWRLWPLYLLAPLAIWLLVLYLLQDLGQLQNWFNRGQLNKATSSLGILTVVGSSTALWIWSQSHQAYLQNKAHLFPHFRGLLLVSAICVFAVVNAVCEEMLYRGIVYGALADSLRNRPLSILLQALTFGVAHFHGIPGGNSGVLLACLYGFFLGLIRDSSDGLMWPILVHACADATIFAIIVTSR